MLERGMTSEEAGWIRANVWTKSMRKTYSECPGFYTHCACQFGLTHYCQHNLHDQCHRATPLRSDEISICGRKGNPLAFVKPFRHPTDTSAVGPHREQYAMVWLADRVCRWVCRCACHTVLPKPNKPILAAVEPVQLDLFSIGA